MFGFGFGLGFGLGRLARDSQSEGRAWGIGSHDLMVTGKVKAKVKDIVKVQFQV
jgi:hypothetical protein